MKLYTVLANSNFGSYQELFDDYTIQKAIPYINKRTIQSIKYDNKKEILSATITGTRKYKVSLRLSNEKDIEIHCNCPAAQDWDPHCKHGAALHILLVEFFFGWDLVSPESSAYYALILRIVFNLYGMQAQQQEKELHLSSGQIVPITKPIIIFIRLPYNLYPRIVFIDPDNKFQEIEKFLYKSIDDFDAAIENILSYKDRLHYYLHSQDGLIPLSYYDSSTIFHPEWHIGKKNEQVDLSFFCKENDAVRKNCAPLGNFYAFDLDNNIIGQLKVANKNCYIRMSRVLLGLAYQCNSIQTTAWSRHAQVGFIRNPRNVLPLITTDTQLNSLQQVLLTPEAINENLSFWDYNQSNVTNHLVINAPIVDKSSVLILKRAIIRDLIDMGFLSLEIEFRVKDVHISPGNLFHLKELIKLLNLCSRTHDKKAAFGLLIHLMQCHQKNMPINSNNGQHVLPAKEFKEFASLIDKFWKKILNQEIFKLLYDADSEQLQKVVVRESDIIMALLMLFEYCIQKDILFAISQDLTIEIASSTFNIADLAIYLEAQAITLYKKNKKIIHKKLDVEIDISNQDNDWFSIHPSFYDKEILLSEAEWKKLLEAAGNMYETEHEIHAFDVQTSSLLDSLRTIKKEYTVEEKKSDKRASFEVPRLHVFTLLSLYRSGARLRLAPEDKKVIDGLHNFTGIPPLSMPEKLQCVLRDYQVKGYEWLGFLYHHKFGACLADEMGLGKTVQTITFLAGIQENKISNLSFKEKRPHLIVAPASVICNWEQEIKKFYPSFSTNLYIGPGRKMNEDVTDIILTTYDIIRMDQEKLIKIPFHVMIFDEAQAVKNSKSQRAHSVCQLQALFKVCLTGTPLENNAQELCSIINLVLPGLLPNDSVISKLIKKGEYQALIERISPFILRRTKKEYLTDLPEKTENNVYLDMTSKQKAIYGAITDEIRQEVYQAYRQKTNAQAGIVALTALLRLRQICISPALLDKTTEKFAPKISYLLEEIKKQQALKIAMLIFSQFTGALDILEKYLKDNKIKFLRIDGSVPTLQRKKIVEEFQNSNVYFVLILSLKTGGVGLNLTKAQVVYHLDPWWNPAVEDQASDRVHRIGQKNEVKIIRVLMKNSIEEKMLVLKQKKKELFDLIMQGSSGARGTAITKQDFDFLLN